MSSDHRIGKYREKTTRNRTPYARPKGFMRRVTDSVSGLLGGSWIPGFLRGDESQNEQAGPSGYSRGAASNPSASHRSLHPIYPEEAGSDEQDDSSAVNNNVAASSSNNTTNNHRINFSASSGDSSSAVLVSGSAASDRDGIIGNLLLGSSSSSSLASDNTVNEKRPNNNNNNNSSSKPFLSTPHSSSRAGRLPSPPNLERRHSLSQRTSEVQPSRRAADCLSEEQPPSVSQCNPVPHALSSRLSTPGDGRAATEGTASARLSAAQSASKRPRFSLAAYNAAASPPGNKSILSDGSFRSSPFYPGRTIYGGAASYRRTPTPVTPSRASTASPRPGADGGLSEAAKKILTCLNAMSTPLTDAKRIPTPAASPYASYLDSPYTAAFHRHRPHHRPPPTSSICTPAKAGVQSNFTQYIVQRTGASSRAPELLPVSSCHDTSVLNPSLDPTDEQPSIFSVAAASSASLKSKDSSNLLLQTDSPRLDTGGSPGLSGRGGAAVPSSSSSSYSFASSSSGAAASVSSPCGSALRGNEPGLSWPRVEEPAAAVTTAAAAGGGKIRPSLKPRHLRSEKNPEFDMPEEPPALPNISLPKVNFSVPIPLSDMMKPPAREPSADKSAVDKSNKSSREGFEFRAPEVLHDPASKQKDNSSSKSVASSSNFSEDSTTSLFNFSAPVSVVTDQSSKDNFVVPKPSLAPKLKSVSPVKVNTSEPARQLVPSSSGLLEFLNKSSGKSSQPAESSIDASSSSKSGEISSSKGGVQGFGDRFKAAAGSWECDTCMVRNTPDKSRCVACDTAKPGSSASSSGASTGTSSSAALTNAKPLQSGFGDAFKKAATDWECDTCLVNNKGDALQCVACQSAKPGATSAVSNSNPLSGSNFVSSSSAGFSFGVPASSSSASVSSTFSFGATASASTTAASSTSSSTFSFGTKSPATTTSTSSTFSFGTKTTVTTTASSTSSMFSFGTNTSTSVPASSSSSTFSFGLKPSSAASQSTSTFSFGVASSSMVPSSSSTVTSSVFGGVSTTSASSSAGPTFSSSSTLNVQSETSSKSTAQSTSSSFGAAKSQGEWDCLSCLQKNTTDRCKSCNAPKSNLNTSTPSNDSPASLPPSGFGDKFKKSAGDWECEVCMVNNKASVEKCVSCEASKPGSTASVKSSLGGAFKFGSNSKPAENPGFQFGFTAPKTAEVSVPETSKSSAPAPSFSFATPSVAPSVVSTSSFSASSTSATKPLFSFGTQSSGTSNGSIHGQEPPASLKFLSPTQEVSTVKPIEKSASSSFEFKTGSETSTLSGVNSNSEKASTNLFTFGAPASKSDGIVAPPAAKIPAFGSSIPDASKNTSFFNSTPAMNCSDQVNANNKRSLKSDDVDVPPNKVANSPFSKNNGLAEPIPQFSFGKGSNATSPPSFQFNSNSSSNVNNSAPAFGNFSTYFGGSAPTGGVFSAVTNNNNNNVSDGLKPGAAPAPTFAFGQPAEKKASTGFDFGQAATPAPTFNFAAGSPASFQFGQPPNAKGGGGGNATNNGVFQFGSSAAAAATPGFGISSGNPFSQTQSATPSGRMVKRAIRRNKK